MTFPHQKPELLAPVGSEEALIAAVRCGADAVYLGAGRFHARQSASPFDEAALRRTVDYCHARGVAVHLTLNTLVREEEFDEALDTARIAAALGIDALIVQDRGLARAIKRAAPDMVLHASTQLSCHTPEGVKALMNEGFSRVVLAREMSSEEIAACCNLGCEIETFVHGALCMSVSGQCFLSAFLGGRSGNRGRCAQPCRLPFSLSGKPSENDRALSLKDLSLCGAVTELAALGVASLKIEGRMKRPEYVAAAVTACRAALDGAPPDPQLLEDLQSVFSRSGFTDGYYTAKRNKTMFGSRTKEDVTAAPKAQKRLQQLYRRERAAVPVSMALTLRENTPLTLTASDRNNHTVTVTGEPPRTVDTPLDEARLRASLQKLGDTPFCIDTITIDREAGTDVPLSAVNALRREATEQLLTLRQTPSSVPFTVPPRETAAPFKTQKPAVVVRLSAAAQVTPSLITQCDLLVLPLETDTATLANYAQSVAVAVEIPRGMFSAEKAIRRALDNAAKAGVKAAVCHNIGAVALCREAGLAAVGGFGLHTTNLVTCFAHRDADLVAATASVELSLRQSNFITDSPIPVGAFVYGRVPLMLLRNCPAAASKGCKSCGKHSTLTDRKGVKFPLTCTYGCTDLLNSVPLYLADKLHEAPPFAFWTLYMTDETPEEVCRIVNAYHHRLPPVGAFTRGLTTKGVD